MSFRNRLLLVVTVVLVLNTVLQLAITLNRAQTAFGSQSRQQALSAYAVADGSLRAVDGAVAGALRSAAGQADVVGILVDAVAGRRPVEDHSVVAAADGLRAEPLDFLRVLGRTSTILSASPDRERFGTPERELRSLAALDAEGPVVTELVVGDARRPALVRFQALPDGLWLIGGGLLTDAFFTEVSERAGAEVYLRAGTTWLGPDGPRDTRPGPSGLEPVAVGDRRVMQASDLTVAEGTIFGAENTLLVVHRERTLGMLARELTRSAILVGSVTLLLSWILGAILARGLTRPLADLTRATRRVAEGRWGEPVEAPTATGEMGQLVTAFNRMQADLVRQREALRRAERTAAWRDAARRVAHEIKNALTPLQLGWERLRASEGTRAPDDPMTTGESTEATAEHMSREIATLRRLVGEFSELAHWPEPQRQPVDLTDLVRSVADLYAAQASITLDVADPGDLVVQADPGQLSRAVANLIQNALDAVPDGSVAIRTYRDETGPAVSVRDRGVGMDEETLARIFDPYYTTKENGTGLGLSIVERVAEANGARVSVHSRRGDGTTIVLHFAEPTTPNPEETHGPSHPDHR